MERNLESRKRIEKSLDKTGKLLIVKSVTWIVILKPSLIYKNVDTTFARVAYQIFITSK